jgi:FlaA1/EpsC-like NDP-sugar epimerase
MGEPIAIGDLAENMIRLAGLTVRSPEKPDGDIEISTVGARPGEKLQEELFYNMADAEATPQAKILRAKRIAAHASDVELALAGLAEALKCEDEAEVRRLLFAFVEHA